MEKSLSSGHAHPVDLHVSSRVRERRRELRLTQKEMADALEVSVQQFQKYESGANRITASKLWDACAALSVDIGYFFKGLNGADDISRANPGPERLQTPIVRMIDAESRALTTCQQKVIVKLLELLAERKGGRPARR